MLLHNNIEDFYQKTAEVLLFTAAILCRLIYCIYFYIIMLYLRNQFWIS